MTDPSARALGRKIAFHRTQRGLSQRDFGALIERSEAWVSQVERGARRIDRMTVLRRVADVLGVPVGELAAETPVVAAVGQRAEPVAELRRLLSSSLRLALVSGSDVDASAASISDEPHRLWELAHAADYDALLPLLIEVLPRLEAAVRRASGEALHHAYTDLAIAYHACSTALSKLRETDAAWVAADRAITAAEHAGDPLLMAEGSFRLTLAFAADRRHEQAEATAVTAIAALEPLTAGDARAAVALQGALRLQLAIIAARQNDGDRAYHQLRLAREAATRLAEDRNDYHTEFGPTNVAAHEVAVAVELGDAGTALRAAAAIDASGLSHERQARLLIDIARAHLQRRHHFDAIQTLCEAEQLTPQQVRRHRTVRSMIDDLSRAGFGGDPRLRGLAERSNLRLSRRRP